jgi:hypothetical protein
MKKLILFLSGILIASAINAQSLDEIVKKYTVANKLDQVSKFKTIKVTAKMSMPAMGMEMPMEMWMKNPNKIKSVTSFNGQDMIQVFDGEKGYMVNPMTGSSSPVEMSADDIASIKRNNMFENYLANYHKEGKLTLLGEEAVNGAPAFKIKAAINPTTTTDMFIDKSTYRLVKSTVNSNSQGMAVSVDSFPTDYQEINGFVIPMKTTMTMQGMEFSIIFSKVEVDVPMEDSIFTVK